MTIIVMMRTITLDVTGMVETVVTIMSQIGIYGVLPVNALILMQEILVLHVKILVGLVITIVMMLITMLLVTGMVEIVVTMKIQVGTNGVQPANALSLRL